MTECRKDSLCVYRHIGFLLLACVSAVVFFQIYGALGLLIALGLVIFLFALEQFYQRRSRVINALQYSQQQLHEAQRLARIGSWEVDVETNHLDWSEELYRIFELDPKDGPRDYRGFLEMVHPDDRKRVDLAYKKAIEDHQPYEIEHRLLMPDGRIKQIRERGETLCAADGTALRSIGTAQDITDLRRMESQISLFEMAFQHSGEAILISDHENRILSVNPAFTTLTGYAQEEVLGCNPRMLSAGRNSREEYERMWTAIRQNGYWQGEVWDRRKDGGIYPKWLSISVIFDDQGSVRYYMAHFTDITAERAAEAKLHHMAHHDMLTGLYNRYSLKDRLEHSLAVARRNSGRVVLMFIDLDRFKGINDTLGHHIGDELLIEVSQRLNQCVRDSDVVARLGGDEFVIMLTGLEHSSSAATIAEKVLILVGQPYAIGPHLLYTTPSIGIAIYPMDGNDSEALMKNADAAMYHAKNSGRNNFQFFNAKMNEVALERLSIEHALRLALGRDEFRLHFQPVIDIQTGRVASVEALIRWQHPERGLLAPGLFISVAEETGLIQPIGDWVFWTACLQLKKFRDAGIADVKMAINISAIQMHNSDLALLARGGIAAHSLVPGDLVFEITESVAMAKPDETVRVLDVLHDMGITLALDDFGTGYSSLSYLRMFPLDELKLDRSFVEEIGQDIDGQVICDATIGLAKNLGLQLVAEGVETEEQLAYLKERGCNLVQGYFFSRPIPADEVMAFIRARNS